MKEIINGIEYSKPQVVLLQETGIGTAEYAARTCYDSFEASENPAVKLMNKFHKKGSITGLAETELYLASRDSLNLTEHSDLLDTLAWTHFHHSILEHANLTYLIQGTSRGVLQEHARHRIQAISVRSTRYTMSSVINAFVASLYSGNAKKWFIGKITPMDLFVTTEVDYNKIEIEGIFNKLMQQRYKLGKDEFERIAVAKSSIEFLEEATSADTLFDQLESGKKKRNVGDAFKHIITDNFKVDMVVTFNLRSLKNYFTLRDSGAAYFGIQWVSAEMIKATPRKYLDLILKQDQINKHLS